MLQDKLTGALIGLARATDGNEHLISASSTAVVVESLFATLTNGSSDDKTLEALIQRVEEEKRKMVPNCFTCASPCGKNNDYDMQKLWGSQEDVRTLKGLLLTGIRGMAACAYQAAALGCHDDTVDRFFYKALVVIGIDGFDREGLLPVVLEMADVNWKCIALLHKASPEKEKQE